MRSLNSGRNSAVGFACQLLALALNFAVRTVFANTLTSEYLGISSLFSNVLTILNLTELGLGSAIVFALYQPLAEHNTGKIKSLMRFYRKSYFFVGCIFFACGLLLMPFLPYLMKGSTELVNINFVYLLYLIQTVTSYWFFAYRKSLLTADQKEYIASVITLLTSVGTTGVQIIILLAAKDQPAGAFYGYVAVGIAFNILSNLIASLVVRKKYPYIADRDVSPLEPEEKKGIFKNVFGLSIYKVSNTVNGSTSNLIISSLVGVSAVGVYSNYLMLTMGVTRMLGAIFTPLTASIGNLNATEGEEKKLYVFNCLHLVYAWVYGFCAICFWVLLNPFIGGIWLGQDWLMPEAVVFALVLKFLIDGLMGSVISFREASGLFWNTRYRYVATVLVNIGCSILFAWTFQMGVLGILLGACVAEIVALLVDPRIVFKHVFQKSAAPFYRKYAGSFLLVLATGALIKLLCAPVDPYTWGGFGFRLLLCAVIPNALWYLLYRKTPEFRYLLEIMGNLLRKLKKSR